LPRARHDAAARQALAQQTQRAREFLKVWGKYRDMDASSINQMKALKDENRRGADVNRPQHAGQSAQEAIKKFGVVIHYLADEYAYSPWIKIGITSEI
jgi:hypothetical protein